MSSETFKFLALGDSYTIGEGVDESERWPVQLVRLLRKDGKGVAEPEVIARTGWTTDELDNAIEECKPVGPFDIVSLLIGVNNQYRGRSCEEYRAHFASLLAKATVLAGRISSHVIVVSIPDWGITPFAEGRDRAQIAREIDAFNAANWEESVVARASYVDITPLSRESLRYPELIAADGLHPSGVQYKYWVELIEPKALKALVVRKENR